MTFLAVSANLSVEIVSSTFCCDGETVAIRTVFVPPLNESCKSRVRLESLYGTKVDPFARS